MVLNAFQLNHAVVMFPYLQSLVQELSTVTTFDTVCLSVYIKEGVSTFTSIQPPLHGKRPFWRCKHGVILVWLISLSLQCWRRAESISLLYASFHSFSFIWKQVKLCSVMVSPMSFLSSSIFPFFYSLWIYQIMKNNNFLYCFY